MRPYPSLAPSYFHNDYYRQKKLVYVQFLTFIVIFSGLCFYVPKLIWKYYENQLFVALFEGIKLLCSSKNNYFKTKYTIYLGKPCIYDYDNMKKYAKEIGRFVSFGKTEFSDLTTGFFLSHIFALCNVTTQLVLMDFIFDNIFTSERLNVLWYLSQSQEYRNDSLALVLPHLVKVCSLIQNITKIKDIFAISLIPFSVIIQFMELVEHIKL